MARQIGHITFHVLPGYRFIQASQETTHNRSIIQMGFRFPPMQRARGQSADL